VVDGGWMITDRSSLSKRLCQGTGGQQKQQETDFQPLLL